LAKHERARKKIKILENHGKEVNYSNTIADERPSKAILRNTIIHPEFILHI
jgi:hypothetical protein